MKFHYIIHFITSNTLNMHTYFTDCEIQNFKIVVSGTLLQPVLKIHEQKL